MGTNQYLDMFLDESSEHLQTMTDGLLQLENEPENIAIVNDIFRGAHTLKGMSATMGYEDMADLTHQAENVLDEIRNEKISASSTAIDILFEAADHLEEMVQAIAESGDANRDVSSTVKKLEQIIKGELDTPVAESSEGTSTGKENFIFNQYERTVLQQSREQEFYTFYINVKLTKNCVLKAARAYMVFEALEGIGEIIKSDPDVERLEEAEFEENFSVALVTKEEQTFVEEVILKISEIEKVMIEVIDKKFEEDQLQQQKIENENKQKTSQGKPTNNKQTTKVASSSKTIRVNIDRLDRLMNLFEELVIDRGRLDKISKELKNNDLTETVERMARVSGDLQDLVLKLRMVPIEQVFNRFPKMIRGLSKELNKKVRLQIEGAETELDRTVIDEIGDPLVHLLRNSIDHGIESPELRESNGKPAEGKIDLNAFHSGNHIFIEIRDDGGGINREGVLKKALENNVITEEEAGQLPDQQVFELLFSSGFSTAEVVSDISGRGVGLDVVKNKIESLGGIVSVDSEWGRGTTFTIQLPLTMSILHAMLVEIQSETYAIPLSSIIEIADIDKEKVFTAHHQKMIEFRGSMVPLINMKKVLDVPGEIDKNQDFVSVVIVRKGDKSAALVVDDFMGQQEIVLKSLGEYLNEVFAITGATILGDGEVALILDTNALIN